MLESVQSVLAGGGSAQDKERHISQMISHLQSIRDTLKHGDQVNVLFSLEVISFVNICCISLSLLFMLTSLLFLPFFSLSLLFSLQTFFLPPLPPLVPITRQNNIILTCCKSKVYNIIHADSDDNAASVSSSLISALTSHGATAASRSRGHTSFILHLSKKHYTVKFTARIFSQSTKLYIIKQSCGCSNIKD